MDVKELQAKLKEREQKNKDSDQNAEESDPTTEAKPKKKEGKASQGKPKASKGGLFFLVSRCRPEELTDRKREALRRRVRNKPSADRCFFNHFDLNEDKWKGTFVYMKSLLGLHSRLNKLERDEKTVHGFYQGLKLQQQEDDDKLKNLLGLAALAVDAENDDTEVYERYTKALYDLVEGNPELSEDGTMMQDIRSKCRLWKKKCEERISANASQMKTTRDGALSADDAESAKTYIKILKEKKKKTDTEELEFLILNKKFPPDAAAGRS
jgi:hypothetical protein